MSQIARYEDQLKDLRTPARATSDTGGVKNAAQSLPLGSHNRLESPPVSFKSLRELAGKIRRICTEMPLTGNHTD